MYKKKHIYHKIKGLKKRKKLWQSLWFWVGLLLVIIIGAGLWATLFWSKFQISELQISGNQKIDTKEVESLAWKDITKKLFFWPYKSIFMVNAQVLKKDVLNAFPILENAQIQKQFPAGLSIVLQERQSYATFCQTSGRCFLMDNNGIIFESLATPVSDMMIVKIPDNKEFSLGESVVEKSSVEAITKVQKSLQDNFQIGVKEALVANLLVLTTSENWKVHFEATQNIDTQIAKMNALLKDQISESARKKLEYIYLQYKDRAYYR